MDKPFLKPNPDIQDQATAVKQQNYYPLPNQDQNSDQYPPNQQNIPPSNMNNPLKDEYLLPTIVDGLIKRGEKVDVLPTDDKWFGVTYKEDKPVVVESFKRLYAQGEYDINLYSDIIK